MWGAAAAHREGPSSGVCPSDVFLLRPRPQVSVVLTLHRRGAMAVRHPGAFAVHGGSCLGARGLWLSQATAMRRGTETRGTMASGARHLLKSGGTFIEMAFEGAQPHYPAQGAIGCPCVPAGRHHQVPFPLYKGGRAGACGVFRQETKSAIAARPSEVAGTRFSSPSRPGGAAALSPGRCLGRPTVSPPPT